MSHTFPNGGKSLAMLGLPKIHGREAEKENMDVRDKKNMEEYVLGINLHLENDILIYNPCLPKSTVLGLDYLPRTSN